MASFPSLSHQSANPDSRVLSLLRIRLEQPLSPGLLPAFRGAVAEFAGHKHVLFHNHTDSGLRYRYPLIQYKTDCGRPLLVCINEGVNEVYEFFRKGLPELLVAGKPYSVKIDELHLDKFLMKAPGEAIFGYRLHNWLALNQVNHQKFKMAANDLERTELLESILIGNIKSFGKSVGWWFEPPVKVRLKGPISGIERKLKGKPMVAFQVGFDANIQLPPFIGLGKSAALGFGTLVPEQMADFHP